MHSFPRSFIKQTADFNHVKLVVRDLSYQLIAWFVCLFPFRPTDPLVGQLDFNPSVRTYDQQCLVGCFICIGCLRLFLLIWLLSRLQPTLSLVLLFVIQSFIRSVHLGVLVKYSSHWVKHVFCLFSARLVVFFRVHSFIVISRCRPIF